MPAMVVTVPEVPRKCAQDLEIRLAEAVRAFEIGERPPHVGTIAS